MNIFDRLTDDAISRDDRLLDLANAIESDDSGYWTNKRISSALRNVSSVTQKSNECEDAISREAVLLYIDEVKKGEIVNFGTLLDMARYYRSLPPVTVRQKSNEFFNFDAPMVKKSMEQQPCDDAVSRADVRQLITKVDRENGGISSKSFKALYDGADELPSVTQKSGKWIPVSEGLPKDNGWYQCTVIVNDLSRTMELFYKNGKWLDNRRINMYNVYDIYGYGNTTEKHKLSYQELISEFERTQTVIAWKPLSQPYKAESEE